MLKLNRKSPLYTYLLSDAMRRLGRAGMELNSKPFVASDDEFAVLVGALQEHADIPMGQSAVDTDAGKCLYSMRKWMLNDTAPIRYGRAQAAVAWPTILAARLVQRNAHPNPILAQLWIAHRAVIEYVSSVVERNPAVFFGEVLYKDMVDVQRHNSLISTEIVNKRVPAVAKVINTMPVKQWLELIARPDILANVRVLRYNELVKAGNSKAMVEYYRAEARRTCTDTFGCFLVPQRVQYWIEQQLAEAPEAFRTNDYRATAVDGVELINMAEAMDVIQYAVREKILNADEIGIWDVRKWTLESAADNREYLMRSAYYYDGSELPDAAFHAPSVEDEIAKIVAELSITLTGKYRARVLGEENVAKLTAALADAYRKL